MKNFIIKVLVFITIPLALIFVFNFISDKVLSDSPLNSEIESKILKLRVKDPENTIIIMGDSRAERQLMPTIIKKQTGCNSINVAASSGDLVSTVYAIRKHYSNYKLIVISASSWQINDGAIASGYLSLKCFQKMSLIDRFTLFFNNFHELVRLEKELCSLTFSNLFSSTFKAEYDEKIIKALGFNGIDKELKVKVAEIYKIVKKHPWYKNLKTDGIRWYIYKEAFKKLGQMKGQIIIYQPPVSPSWKDNTCNTKIDIAEKSYSAKVKKLADQHSNVKFYDFYKNTPKSLNDKMYYDYQHLNLKGAEIFSNIMAHKILNEFEIKK